MSDVLPLELVDTPVSDICWYCGSTAGPWEREHQLPVSRGGESGDNLVRACAACNHLKGKLTLEEFRTALELRLGVSPVVFVGEARSDLPATPIAAVRSLAGTPAVVKLDPVVSERLDRALTWLGRRGRGRLTRKDAVSAAVTAWLDDIAAAELAGADFPADDVLPFDGFEAPPIIRHGQASQTPRQVWDREVTKVDGYVLEQARRAVRFLGSVERSTTLLQFVSEALATRLDALQERYPQFGPLRSAPLMPSSAPEIGESVGK